MQVRDFRSMENPSTQLTCMSENTTGMHKVMEKQIIQANTNPVITGTVYPILIMISISHLLNDSIQSLIPSIYPIVKVNYHLNFSQIGLITLTFQLAASLLQPLVGLYTDHRPKPFSLVTAMGISLIGLIAMSQAGNFHFLLFSVALIGIGSSIFHPEASKVAYMASGGKRGLAQSIFQVGGNAGSSLGPLMAALVIVPLGQSSIGLFAILPLIALGVLIYVGRWYKSHLNSLKLKSKIRDSNQPVFSKTKIFWSILILIVLIFSKYFYLASMVSYLTFYMIEKFKVSVQHAQIFLFIFTFSVAAGTFWVVLWAIVSEGIRNLVFDPGSSAIHIVTATCKSFLDSGFDSSDRSHSGFGIFRHSRLRPGLLPGKVGMISGLFFGFAFGMGGLGSALLGILADHKELFTYIRFVAFLPLIGLLTGFLPNIGGRKRTTA